MIVGAVTPAHTDRHNHSRGERSAVANIAELGFAEDEPFLAVVVGDEPLYQEVKDSQNLRQYLGELGPSADGGSTPGAGRSVTLFIDRIERHA